MHVSNMFRILKDTNGVILMVLFAN